mgnify:FL=1
MSTTDRVRTEIKFGSTNDSGFNISNVEMLHDGFQSTGSKAFNSRKKKFPYRTLTSNDDKARSVSSIVPRMDHTCFI